MSLQIVFDFGAVLFRWRPQVLLQRHLMLRSMAELQAAQDEVFQGYGGDWGDFDLGRIDATELAQRLAARTRWPLALLRALIDAVPDELNVQPGVLSLLLQLRQRGHRLAYLSNMPRPYANALECRYPLSSWFDTGLFSGHEGLSKPDPALFALAAQRFQAEPVNCLLIDDHPANITAARACGWQAEGFVDASRLRRALLARGLLDQVVVQ